jgi:hypothetical protein
MVLLSKSIFHVQKLTKYNPKEIDFGFLKLSISASIAQINNYLSFVRLNWTTNFS